MYQYASIKYQISISETDVIKQKVLEWLKAFNTFCFMDSNHYAHNTRYHFLAAADVKNSCTISSESEINEINHFMDSGNWYFGHLCYESITHGVSVKDNLDEIHFPQIFFYQPKTVITLCDDVLEIFADNPKEIYRQITAIHLSDTLKKTINTVVAVQQFFNREQYIDIIKQLQKHIQRGNCYEINFCQKYFINQYDADIWQLYKNLVAISPNPQSCLYKVNDAVLICASPERFIKKISDKIISQPIKGTLARTATTATTLAAEQAALWNSAKDRAENIMVVDMVRNDLSKICTPGSVKVEELFGIYSFPQVHQMITTISGLLCKDISISKLLKATFPMGSMTGAPKKRVMELIQEYEPYQRGIFSGTVGYISPNGDFDFNVVIRSILYNTQSKYLSFYAGSGITAYSNAEKEWEECEIKAAAIRKVLEPSY